MQTTKLTLEQETLKRFYYEPEIKKNSKNEEHIHYIIKTPLGYITIFQNIGFPELFFWSEKDQEIAKEALNK